MSDVGVSIWVSTLLVCLMLGLVIRCLMVIAEILTELQKEQGYQLERIGDNTDTESKDDDLDVGQTQEDMPQIFD